MLFPTITFGVFFLLVFVGSWLLMPRPLLWKVFIILASGVFYGWGVFVILQGVGFWTRVVFMLLLPGSALVNWLFAEAVVRAGSVAARKWLLAAAVAVNLGVLGYFKYRGFFVTSLTDSLDAIGLGADVPLARIIIPVGLSFLTFRVLSYVVDVYRGKLPTASLIDFVVYVAFFPYIMAGPIARAQEFLPQLVSPRDPRRIDTARAFFLIFAGLAKKMLLADYLYASIVNGVFHTPGQYTSLETLLGIIGYSVYIYCDFSAYSDIAIGISLLLGFELPDNFNAPYSAVSVQDFWRRWHMTLSRWLRDYLYIPLGGNRKGQTRTYLNIMITMLLGGLWHGAGWGFVFWGGLHGGAQVVEHRRVYVRRARARHRRPAALFDLEAATSELGAAALGPVATSTAVVTAPPSEEVDTRPWGGGVWPRVGTFAFVTFAWVYFGAASFNLSFGAALSVLAQLFRGWGSVGAAVTPVLLLVIALGIGIQYVPHGVTERVQARFSGLNPGLQGVALAAGFMLLDVLGPAGGALFLYFGF